MRVVDYEKSHSLLQIYHEVITLTNVHMIIYQQNESKYLRDYFDLLMEINGILKNELSQLLILSLTSYNL